MVSRSVRLTHLTPASASRSTALVHAVGEDADDAQHLRAGGPQGDHGVQHTAAGGDQVLDDHHPLAGGQLALDLVPAAVILAAGADVAHRQAQQVGGDGGMGDTGGGRYP